MSVTVLSEHHRRAAHGKHACRLCGRKIAAGEKYLDQRCADSGTAWTFRVHLACNSAYWSWSPEPDDFVDFREMVEGHLPPCPWAWLERSHEPCECPQPEKTDSRVEPDGAT